MQEPCATCFQKQAIGLLSTATQLLYDDEEMEAATTTTADTITNKPPLPGMCVSDRANILLPEDNNTSIAPLPRQRKSSFQDELSLRETLVRSWTTESIPLPPADRSQPEGDRTCRPLTRWGRRRGSNVGGAVVQEDGGTRGKEGARVEGGRRW